MEDTLEEIRRSIRCLSDLPNRVDQIEGTADGRATQMKSLLEEVAELERTLNPFLEWFEDYRKEVVQEFEDVWKNMNRIQRELEEMRHGPESPALDAGYTGDDEQAGQNPPVRRAKRAKGPETVANTEISRNQLTVSG